MTERLKPSKYNHFVPGSDGNWLAFNAMLCGLAELDEATYHQVLRLVAGATPKEAGVSDDVLENLKAGGFLVDSEMDEVKAVRAHHYRVRFAPTGFSLTVVPTYACNFGCIYCYENPGLRAMPAEQGSVMSEDMCANVVALGRQRVSANDSLHVTWYGGEPLIGKKVIGSLSEQLMAVCREKNSSYHAAIVTNGYLLDEENLRFLRDCRVSFVQITIDGPRDVHDGRRPLRSGRATYDTIMANIGRIPADYPMHLSIRINIDRDNADRVPELFDDFREMKLHERPNVSFNFGHTAHYGSCSAGSLNCMATEEFSEFIVKAFKTGIDYGFRVAILPSTNLSGCGAVGLSNALIEPNGNVQTCWVTVGADEKSVGLLTADGIVYNHRQARWLGWDPFAGECEACSVLPICMGGCPNKALFRDDGAGESGNVCTWWKYDLKPMLTVARYAQEHGLLALPGRSG